MPKPTVLLFASVLTAFASAAIGCKSSTQDVTATAELTPLGASGVGGTVNFTASNGGVRVEARITGLSPGDHGFHIHEYGDCAGPDGMSAGDHFNPDKTEHGAPNAPQRHAGDLGNISGVGSGKLATLNMTIEGVTLDTGPRGILGRSVVVHAAPDDYASQPSGNSGGRIACGVIRSTSGETVPVKPAN
jgi:Cu-Zn family superoxide dismutase